MNTYSPGCDFIDIEYNTPIYRFDKNSSNVQFIN